MPFRLSFRSLVSPLLVVALAACGGDDGGPTGPNRTPASVVVSPDDVTLASLDESVTLSAVALDASGDELSGQSFTWTTSDASVASVDAAGVVRAIGNGAATVSAHLGALQADVSVAVEQVAAAVAITPGAGQVQFPGDSAKFSASVVDANGRALETQPAIAWSSSDEAVATVDANGTAHAQALGSVTLTAASGALQDDVGFEVTGETSFDFLVGEWNVTSTYDDGTGDETTEGSSIVEREGRVLLEDWRGEHGGVAVGVFGGMARGAGVHLAARVDALRGVFTVVEGTFDRDTTRLTSGNRLGAAPAERVLYTDMLGDSFTVLVQREAGPAWETFWTLRYRRATAALPPRSEPVGSACAAADYREFDFWLGDWDVVGAGGGTGTNLVHTVAGDCAVRENWRGSGGDTGTSLNMYDPRTDQWKQVWFGGGGTDLELDGQLAGDDMVLSGPSRNLAGVIDRITWSPLAGGDVRQLWQRSSDGGATFPTTVFDGNYSM